MEFKHESVLLDECIENLDIKQNGIYVDGTLGGGGHTKYILDKLSASGLVIGIDKDIDAINFAKTRLSEFSNIVYINDENSNIIEILEKQKISGVDGILIDLGVSSYQLDEASRGFSYMKDAPLDMRMNQEQGLSAYDVVNKYSEDSLIKIFFEYGEEKYSKRIANRICIQRKIKPIVTTLELVDVIKRAMPGIALKEKQHPAKRTFQAIRIEVNGELEKLERTIIDSISVLKPDGRLCIITFHSLEDRIVKETYLKMQGRCTCSKDLPICVCNFKSYGKVITKKAIISTDEELQQNPRARSAKLRVFQKK